jgi:hypothetical protein
MVASMAKQDGLIDALTNNTKTTIVYWVWFKEGKSCGSKKKVQCLVLMLE